MEQVTGLSLSSERWAELRPRLAVLLADFDELKTLETTELEPMPAFRVERGESDVGD
jgi:hypothetical protein